MRTKFFSIAAILLILTASCRKDTVIPTTEEDCYFFGSSSSALGFQFSFPQSWYRTPCFNPSNNDQFIYVREDKQNPGITELHRRTISTAADVILLTGVMDIPQWHANGWILLTRNDNLIWKIKANGDSLTQLTFDGMNLGARWSPAGDKFVYRKAVGSTSYAIIANAQGISLDTLAGFIPEYGDWSPDGTKLCSVVGAGSGSIAYYDFSTGQAINVATVPSGEFVLRAYWQRDSRTICWNTRKGVYKTDINTHSTIRMLNSCDSKLWWTFQFSGNGQKIIWERNNSRLTGNDHNTIYQEDFIYISNADGTAQEKINIQ
jgi:Tol biopolymer transport system component